MGRLPNHFAKKENDLTFAALFSNLFRKNRRPCSPAFFFNALGYPQPWNAL
jgi:hypothetical protein